MQQMQRGKTFAREELSAIPRSSPTTRLESVKSAFGKREGLGLERGKAEQEYFESPLGTNGDRLENNRFRPRKSFGSVHDEIPNLNLELLSLGLQSVSGGILIYKIV